MAANPDEELAAFEAEMAKLAEPSATSGPTTAGPKAPRVISAAPMRPSAAAESAIPLPASMLAGGGRPLPVSEWPNPQQIVQSLPYDHQTLLPPAADAPTGMQMHPPAMPPGGMSVAGGMYASGSYMAPPPSNSAKLAQPVPAKGGKAAAADTSAVGAPRKRTADVSERSVAGVSWADPSLKDWAEDDFRIFVGDLGNETNDDVLAHAFAKYPSFQKARVVRNKATQKTMGFGFVSFKDPWDMTKALREMHGKYIGNRPVKVRKSTWKERGADNSQIEPAWSLATKDKKAHQKIEDSQQKKQKKTHVHAKKKGMPW